MGGVDFVDLAGKTQGQDGGVGTSCLGSYLSTFFETCSGINLSGVRIVRAQENPKRLCLPFPLRRKCGLFQFCECEGD